MWMLLFKVLESQNHVQSIDTVNVFGVLKATNQQFSFEFEDLEQLALLAVSVVMLLLLEHVLVDVDDSSSQTSFGKYLHEL